MRAAVVRPGLPGSIHVEDRPAPPLSPEQVLVGVLEVGIDGTDRDIDRGEYGEAPDGRSDLIVAHESVGTVAEVGSGVSGLLPGDTVVATVRRPCPERCLNCAAGEFDHCMTGHYLERGIKGLDGYASDYYVEAPEFLVRVPDALRSVAVLLEPLSIAQKAIREAFHVQSRMTWQPRHALVIGAGSLGLLVALGLRLRGLEVAVIDRVPPDHAKARRVEELGARYFDLHVAPLITLPRTLGPLDLIIEAAGDSKTIFDSLQILGNNGILVTLGLSTTRGNLTIPADVLNLERVLENLTVLGCVNSHHKDFEQGAADMLAAEQRFPGWLDGLITRRLPLADISAAMGRSPEDIKVVMTLAP